VAAADIDSVLDVDENSDSGADLAPENDVVPRRRPADKRNEGRRRRQRQSVTGEAPVSEVTGTAPEAQETPVDDSQNTADVQTRDSALAAAPLDAGTNADAGAAVAIASSDALSAAFPETDNVTETEPDLAADSENALQGEPDVVATAAAPEPVAANDTSGLTANGRAVNDPRVAPRPVTETAVKTELGVLFANPEAPPVTIVQQNVPRASNDPRGPRAA
jgi:ribonuclease E